MKRVVVLVASTRCAAGRAVDRTGPVIVEWLRGRGWSTDHLVVADGDPVGDALRRALEQNVELIVTTGGTGINPTDRTPEQTLPLLDQVLPGIGEAIRARGMSSTPLAVLSRGVAGIAGRSVIVNLPGSPSGVADGIAVLDDVIEHIISQLAGGDHVTP
ncbi:molybdenum cofactor synthesis domain-containing protein [Microbacterium sp. SORGH_AS 1204]|uniref:MogA/MoaB family molybdenum cofactor biosynthesis protein n=1 Tax=Microbacterium sp. SORGH_AS_1204 TaxID=3041785 RepID=UPI002793B163|nr:MogA/MoaB family molybdenum cofactor biosynthesis protein [Microbacterium sp. SORGH_AS_1204]MDQ1137785.1 molybdenum cofactor synthesis domain-containing protein [Microbacterium sp. SORGH_AS_1204]